MDTCHTDAAALPSHLLHAGVDSRPVLDILIGLAELPATRSAPVTHCRTRIEDSQPASLQCLVMLHVTLGNKVSSSATA